MNNDFIADNPAGLNQFIPRTGEAWTLYRDGEEYLYCWNPATGETGWLDRSDMIHNAEAMAARGNI